MYKNQKGFTLIELLIVIVIIGILAGVLIAVIDPASQQNRARDAGVQATMNKVALAVEGFNSAYGRTPFDDEFMGAVQNSTELGVTCSAGNDKLCEFTVTGNDLIVGTGAVGATDACAAGGWNGLGNVPCNYHYYGDVGAAAPPTHFRITARSFGIIGTAFVYDNKVGGITECDVTTLIDVVCSTDACPELTDGDPCL